MRHVWSGVQAPSSTPTPTGSGGQDGGQPCPVRLAIRHRGDQHRAGRSVGAGRRRRPAVGGVQRGEGVQGGEGGGEVVGHHQPRHGGHPGGRAADEAHHVGCGCDDGRAMTGRVEQNGDQQAAGGA
jgi:hypothetical protein